MRAALALVLLVAAGCAPAAQDPVASRGSPEGPPVGNEAPERSAAERGDQAACDDSTADAVEDVVAAQMSAFAVGDLQQAWSYASDGFRHAVDVDELSTIVESDFPIVLDADEHAVGHCTADVERAHVLVEVTAGDEQHEVLAYRLVYEHGDWRVDAAVRMREDLELAAW